LKSLAVALIDKGRIETSEAKAKSLRPMVEKMISRARRGDLSDRRILVSRLGSGHSADKLIRDVAPRYLKRLGGYTRIVKLPARLSDSSRRAIIEFV